MFFVGATGQLLTLILTVCLPFVFLLSGQQKIAVEQTTFHFESQQIHSEISSIDYNTYQFNDIITDEIQILQLEFDHSEVQQKIPEESPNEWKSVCSTSSGNKAPPAIPCFSC